MSDISIDFRIEQDTVYAALERMDTGFSSSAWAVFLYGVMGEHLQQRARMRFRNEGDDVVGVWRPLKESTKRIRVEAGFMPGPINHRTGELERFLTEGSNFTSVPVGPIAELTYPVLPSGELKEKLKTAQMGKKKPATVPRPVVGLNEADLMFLVSAMSVYARKVTGEVRR